MMPDTPINPAALRELLAFYADAGSIDALDDVAVNHFEAPQVQARASAPSGQPMRPPVPAPAVHGKITVPDEGQIINARQLAASASTIEELRALLETFDGCNLKATAKNLVFADGNPAADLMLVGEAPGRDEDIEGLPFVGRSGKLLDRILAAIGRDRDSAYISNVIPWRPPGNRDPSAIETEICRPFIERHIELVRPKVLITLGNPSTKILLNTTQGIMRMRGSWSTYATKDGQEIPTMPTLHPAYLLRNPAHKKLAWRDFLEIRIKLDAGQS